MSVEMTVFYPDGKPNGVVDIIKANASGYAIAFPRDLCDSVRLNERYNDRIFRRNCVYVLWGPGAHNQKPAVYVGQSIQRFADRIIGHMQQKEYWTRAVVYTDALRALPASQIEARLVQCASEAKVCDLKNTQKPRNLSQNDADAATTENHIYDLTRFFLPLAGCDFFRKRDNLTAVQTTKAAPAVVATVPQNGELFLRQRRKDIDIEAQGRETDEGFLVYAGSQASKYEIPTYRQKGKGFERHVAIRDDLIKRNILTDDGNVFRFVQDYSFQSSWYAATVILGTNPTASKTWKDAEGRTLEELQKQKT